MKDKTLTRADQQAQTSTLGEDLNEDHMSMGRGRGTVKDRKGLLVKH